MSSVAEEALRKIEEAKAKAAADAIAAEEAAKKAKTAELEKFWKAVRKIKFTCLSTKFDEMTDPVNRIQPS